METEVKEFQSASTDELFGGTSSPNTEAETSQEKSEVTEEKKEAKVEKTETKPKEEKETLPSPEKEGAEEVKAFDWEKEDNPYKKRYYDTQKWANTINQQNLELKRSVEVIGKKLDGTYDESADIANQLSPEAEKEQAAFQGRLIASNKAATEQYGEEFIQKMLYAPDAPFQNLNKDPSVHARVYNSEAPALEALKIVKEHLFFSKYGRDVDKIETKIRETLKAELREEITKEFREKLKMKEKQPKGLEGMTGEAPSSEKKGYASPSAKDLWGVKINMTKIKPGFSKGSANPGWKGGIWLQERKCKTCGKTFTAIGSMVNSDKYRHKGLYCSRECANKSHIVPKVEIKCKQCEKIFEVIPAKAKTATFCSVTCKTQWQKENPRLGTKWRNGKPIDKDHYRELSRVQHSKRKARKLNAEGHFTKEEWELLKRQYHHRCPSCGQSEPQIVLTVDHIVPLTKGGTNWIWNIQPLCKSCNSSKMMKTVRFSKRIKGQIEIL